MLLNVFYRIANGANVLGIFVLDLKVEFLLHRHDDLNEIKRIGVQITDELSAFNNLIGIDAKSLHGDRLYSLECCCQIRTLLQIVVLARRNGRTLNPCHRQTNLAACAIHPPLET